MRITVIVFATMTTEQNHRLTQKRLVIRMKSPPVATSPTSTSSFPWKLGRLCTLRASCARIPDACGTFSTCHACAMGTHRRASTLAPLTSRETGIYAPKDLTQRVGCNKCSPNHSLSSLSLSLHRDINGDLQSSNCSPPHGEKNQSSARRVRSSFLRRLLRLSSFQ